MLSQTQSSSGAPVTPQMDIICKVNGSLKRKKQIIFSYSKNLTDKDVTKLEIPIADNDRIKGGGSIKVSGSIAENPDTYILKIIRICNDYSLKQDFEKSLIDDGPISVALKNIKTKTVVGEKPFQRLTDAYGVYARFDLKDEGDYEILIGNSAISQAKKALQATPTVPNNQYWMLP